MNPKDFRDPEKLPKILIVTEKLLTGFDAPILYCMYLDKPMRDHVLLQAIARVNRPYEDEGKRKPSGFVLDFVGIFENLEKALAFDSQDIEGVVHDLQLLKARFAQLMERAQSQYLPLIQGKKEGKAVEEVLAFFLDEEARREFYGFVREVIDIYDILSPDSFLRPYLDDYETLVRMYRISKEAYEPGLGIDKEFSRKTAKLVQEHTKSGKIRSSLEIYEIDEDTLRRIEESQASATEKIFNLIKSLQGGGERGPWSFSPQGYRSTFPRLRRLNPGVPGNIGTPREEFSLPPAGSETVGTLGGEPGEPITGWARIESTTEIGVVATVQYRVAVNGEVVSSASVIPEPLTQKFSTFAFNDCEEASTGIALLNPSETESAEIEVSLFNQDGTFRDKRTIILEPRHQIAQFFDEGELFTDLGPFCGSAEISSSLPIAITVIRVDDIYWSTFRTFPPLSE